MRKVLPCQGQTYAQACAGRGETSLVQRAAEVGAVVGQRAHLGPAAQHEQAEIAERQPHRPAVRQVAGPAQVMPAERRQVGDRLGVAGAGGQPEGQVPWS